MNLQLLWRQFLSPIFFINQANCSHSAFKMILFCITVSILSTSFYISFRKVYQMIKTSSQLSLAYLFVDLLQVYKNCLGFVDDLERRIILKLLEECSLIVDLSKLERSTFVRPLALYWWRQSIFSELIAKTSSLRSCPHIRIFYSFKTIINNQSA